MTKPGETCLTCYGEGTVGTEVGPTACPDCFGEGKAPSRSAQLEWRIRDIERASGRSGREAEADVIWLCHELRRSREALVRIIARCEDAEGGSTAVRDIKYEANDALGLYEPT